MQLLPGDDVRAAIAPMVGVIRRALDAGVGQWHGYTETCRVRQVRLLLSHYFHYHEGCIGAEALAPPYNHVKKYTFPDLTLCLVNVYTVITVNIYFSCVILI